VGDFFTLYTIYHHLCFVSSTQHITLNILINTEGNTRSFHFTIRLVSFAFLTRKIQLNSIVFSNSGISIMSSNRDMFFFLLLLLDQMLPWVSWHRVSLVCTGENAFANMGGGGYWKCLDLLMFRIRNTNEFYILDCSFIQKRFLLFEYI